MLPAALYQLDEVQGTPGGLPAELFPYLDSAIPENTRQALRYDLADLARWASQKGIASLLPLSEVDCACYLAELSEAGRSTATIDRRAASISLAHRLANLPSPCSSELARKVRHGIARLRGRGQGKRPLLLGELLTVLEAIESGGPLGCRDRALLLVGWCGAMRRSELVGLQWEDLEATERGYRVRLRRSKTDQAGAGQFLPLHARQGRWCPCRALEELRATLGGPSSGPIFVGRSGQLAPQAVWRVLRRRLEAVGFDSRQYGAHSLRSGLVVSARERGASERAIMAVTRHRSLAGLAPYLARADTFTEDPAGIAGLR